MDGANSAILYSGLEVGNKNPLEISRGSAFALLAEMIFAQRPPGEVMPD